MSILYYSLTIKYCDCRNEHNEVMVPLWDTWQLFKLIRLYGKHSFKVTNCLGRELRESHWPRVAPMLDERIWRCPNSDTALVQRLLWNDRLGYLSVCMSLSRHGIFWIKVWNRGLATNITSLLLNVLSELCLLRLNISNLESLTCDWLCVSM